MIKSALLAATAAILLCSVGSASAATVKYTFDGYCDGLTLKESGGLATGTHTGKKCTGGEGDYAGGFSGKKVLGSVDTEWVITTGETAGAAGETDVFIIDQTAMTWSAYTETTNTTAFALVNSGTLTDGAPPDVATPGPALRSAITPASK